MDITSGLAALGGGAFVIASLVLGARLMLLSRRTGGFPELVMGAGLFLMGGVSYPLTLAALQGTGLPHGARIAMIVAHMVFNTAGMTAIAVFTRRVFRPEAGWATLLVVAVGLGYAVPFALQVFGPGLGAYLQDTHGPWYWTRPAAIAAPFWAGLESLRYHRMLRKRLELGLADPVVVDRFRLWWIAMWCASVITSISVVLEAAGIRVIETPAGGVLVGSLGLVIAGALWMAFFPPQAYLRRVRARAAA